MPRTGESGWKAVDQGLQVLIHFPEQRFHSAWLMPLWRTRRGPKEGMGIAVGNLGASLLVD